MRRTAFSMLFLGLIVLGQLPLQTSAQTGNEVSINIVDAYYTDADNDGLKDDVVAIVDIDISTYRVVYFLQYEIYLVMPSGTVHGYLYLIMTTYSQMRITNYFYNHATEQGDYTIYVYADFAGTLYPSAQDHHTFDPPGGDNADPPGWGIQIDPRT